MAKAALKVAMVIVTGLLLVCSFHHAPTANAAMNNLSPEERMQLINQSDQTLTQVTQMWTQTHNQMHSMMVRGSLTPSEQQMMKMADSMMNMIQMLAQTNQNILNIEKGTNMNK